MHFGTCIRLTATQVVESEFHVPIAFSIDGTPYAISAPVAHDLLMVAREAVSNAVLHGHPAHVWVSLEYKASELILRFADDGCGFETSLLKTQDGHHFGIKGMRERIERWGGGFNLKSAMGKGVHIEVQLPRNRRKIPRSRNAQSNRGDAVSTNRP
jgi:signal transduction histidine kinase